MGRLCSLTVYVEAALQDNFMYCSIFDSSVIVIATITNLEGLIFDVRFVIEDRVREEILAKIVFASLQAERASRSEVAAPPQTSKSHS